MEDGAEGTELKEREQGRKRRLLGGHGCHSSLQLAFQHQMRTVSACQESVMEGVGLMALCRSLLNLSAPDRF